MTRGRPTFERTSGSIGNQVVIPLMHIGGIDGFEGVQRVIRSWLDESCMTAIGDNETESVVLRHEVFSGLIGGISKP